MILQQDGLTNIGDGNLPGGLDCTNCSDVVVNDCSFTKMGGSGVTFGGVAKRINMTMLDISDVSGNGIMVGDHGNDTAEFQSVQNVVSDCVVRFAAREFTGCVGVYAGYNLGLLLTHNTVTDLSYGGFSIGAGAARPGYARDNVLSFNRVERWMGKMQDSAAIYVTGRQPGSVMKGNFLSGQGLSGLEPPPQCDDPAVGRRCTVAEVIAEEDVWIREVGAPYCAAHPGSCQPYISSCNKTEEGWCNQTGNAHGGGIYGDNGSAGWHATENVMEGIYHWMFVWDGRPDKMVDMLFDANWVRLSIYFRRCVPPDYSATDLRLIWVYILAPG